MSATSKSKNSEQERWKEMHKLVRASKKEARWSRRPAQGGHKLSKEENNKNLADREGSQRNRQQTLHGSGNSIP